jgi:hypothetical protein
MLDSRRKLKVSSQNVDVGDKFNVVFQFTSISPVHAYSTQHTSQLVLLRRSTMIVSRIVRLIGRTSSRNGYLSTTLATKASTKTRTLMSVSRAPATNRTKSFRLGTGVIEQLFARRSLPCFHKLRPNTTPSEPLMSRDLRSRDLER